MSISNFRLTDSTRDLVFVAQESLSDKNLILLNVVSKPCCRLETRFCCLAAILRIIIIKFLILPPTKSPCQWYIAVPIDFKFGSHVKRKKSMFVLGCHGNRSRDLAAVPDFNFKIYLICIKLDRSKFC